MTITRRTALATAAASAIAAPALADKKETPMYGLIGQMTAAPGKRDVLAAILTDMGEAMPGCFSYIVAIDPANPDAIWITEVWDSKASHEASLKLPAVQAAIA